MEAKALELISLVHFGAEATCIVPYRMRLKTVTTKPRAVIEANQYITADQDLGNEDVGSFGKYDIFDS